MAVGRVTTAGLVLLCLALVPHGLEAAPKSGGGGGRTKVTDTISPVISNLTVSNLTSSRATVSWQTNEAAIGQVQYGLTTSYGQLTSPDALSTGHSMTLTGLSGGTTYHFRVQAKDKAGNLTTSPDQALTTLPTPPPAAVTSWPFYIFGYGSQTTGGYTGEQILVTTLADNYPSLSSQKCPDPDGVPGGLTDCTLREALTKPNRHITFAVSGTIIPVAQLAIMQPNTTIDGSTGPGGGIQLQGNPSPVLPYTSLFGVNADNVIVRHLRFRRGLLEPKGSGLQIVGGNNVVLDHISCEWGSGGCLTINNTLTDAPITNVTVQHSIFAEGLDQAEGADSSNSKAVLVAANSKNISFYRNLFALNNKRFPSLAPGYRYNSSLQHQFFTGIGYYDVVENIMYDYQYQAYVVSYSQTWSTNADFMRNLYLPGPDSGRWATVPPIQLLYSPTSQWSTMEVYGAATVYLEGNIGPTRPANHLAECLIAAEWYMGYENPCNLVGKVGYNGTPFLSSTPLAGHPIPGNLSSGLEIYEPVLTDVGATRPCLDAVDSRVITHVRNRTGTYVERSPAEVGGYPDLTRGCSP